MEHKVEATHAGRTAAVIVRSSATAPAATASREVVKIKLGDINARIAPLSINADGLALLGFKPINATGAAKLYDQAQFPDMCRAMMHGLQDAADSYPLAAGWTSPYTPPTPRACAVPARLAPSCSPM